MTAETDMRGGNATFENDRVTWETVVKADEEIKRSSRPSRRRMTLATAKQQC